MANEHTGSETIGAAGEKSKMTLFRDDRAEDFGAILLAIIVVALIIVMTAGKTSATATPPAQTTPSGMTGMQGTGGMQGAGAPAARP